VAGYLIAAATFVFPLFFGASGLGRPRLVLTAGMILAFCLIVVLTTGQVQDGQGHKLVPLWFLAGLVALLYAIWCGGLWVGLRLRHTRPS
jgi:biotin transporter BioY